MARAEVPRPCQRLASRNGGRLFPADSSNPPPFFARTLPALADLPCPPRWSSRATSSPVASLARSGSPVCASSWAGNSSSWISGGRGHLTPVRLGVQGLMRPDSCRRRGDKWIVAMNKWQDLTDMEINEGGQLSSDGHPRFRR